MQNEKDQSITLGDIKGILPFGVLLVSVVLSWASLSARQDLLSERQIISDRKLDRVEEKVSSINDDLVRVKTILDSAREAGQLSFQLSPTPQAFATTASTKAPLPTSTAGQSATVVPAPESHSIVINQPPAERFAPTPTPNPELPTPLPPPPQPTPLVCLLTLCL